jgi:hypothetical protein
MQTAAIKTTHEISKFRSPISIQLRCSCGWSRQITRQQNALARAAKVRAAIAEHERSVDANRRMENGNDR